MQALATEGNWFTSPTFAVVLGLVSTVGALVAIGLGAAQSRDLRRSIAKLEGTEQSLKATQQSVDELSREMYDLVGMDQATRGVDGLVAQISGLAKNNALIWQREMPYITDHFKQQLRDLAAQSSQAASYAIELFPQDIMKVAVELLDFVQPSDEIFTTSWVNTEEFCDSDFARTYLRQSERLINEHKVKKITRVFIFDDEGDDKVRQEQEARAQSHSDIEVRIAYARQLDGDLRRDMFLFGDRLSAEYNLGKGGDLESVRVYVAPHSEVADAVKRRARLLAFSKTQDPKREKIVSPDEIAQTSLNND